MVDVRKRMGMESKGCKKLLLAIKKLLLLSKETLSLGNGLKVKSFKHRLKFVLPLRK